MRHLTNATPTYDTAEVVVARVAEPDVMAKVVICPVCLTAGVECSC